MSDRVPRLLLCGFGSFPGVPANPSALTVEALREEVWKPRWAEARYAILPVTWDGAFVSAARALNETGADGVLMIGVAVGAEMFRVEMRAQNRTRTDAPDAEGHCRASPRIAPLGPATARTGVPVEPMVEALEAAGLEAYASSDAGEYLCNYAFYRMLTERAAIPTAFLHIPPVRETLSLDDIGRGVRAVAEVFARTLAFGRPAEAGAA